MIGVLSDPASAGEGGNRDEPLLLVKKLALDETDAVFGSSEDIYLGHAAHAGTWGSSAGGFNRWVETYYRKVLGGTRPVLVTVTVSSYHDLWAALVCCGCWRCRHCSR